MKRFWHTWLAIVASVTLVGFANAQNDWNQPSEIGSYQSILSRAGYDNGMAGGMQGAGCAGCDSGAMSGGYGGGQMGGAYGGGQMMGGGQMGGAYGGGQMMGGGQMGGAYGGGQMMGGGQMGGAYGGGQMMGGGQMGGAYGGGQMMGGGQMGGAYGGGQMMGGGQMGGAYGGGQAMGGQVDGGMATGEAMGTVVDGGMASGSVMNGGMMSGSQGMITGGGFGNAYSGAVGGYSGYSAPVYSAPAYSAPVYYSAPQQQFSAPVYNPGAAFQRPRANYVGGIFGLNFERDYEDKRQVAVNPAGQRLFTDQAEDTLNGFGLSLTRRGANGRGTEFRYWALNPGPAIAELNGSPAYTTIRGYADLWHAPSGTDLFNTFAFGTSQRVVRETDINNVEINFLRNGGTYCKKGRRGSYELVSGLRWLQFDETLSYISDNDLVGYPTYPAQITYESSVTNTLLGFQLGARNELALGNKLRVFTGVNGGIFNNDINVRQRFFDETGYNPIINTGPFAGDAYDFQDDKSDVAFLGELDLGLIFQVSCKIRARIGYRALGIGGIALAGDQMPYDYSDRIEIERAQSNGSLLLHGGYYGLKMCF